MFQSNVIFGFFAHHSVPASHILAFSPCCVTVFVSQLFIFQLQSPVFLRNMRLWELYVMLNILVVKWFFALIQASKFFFQLFVNTRNLSSSKRKKNCPFKMGFLKHNFITCISINDVIKKLMIWGAELMKPRISMSRKIQIQRDNV